MHYARAALTSLILVSASSVVSAQEAQPGPAENAKALSATIMEIEKRPDFRFVESVEWEEQGYYEITYRTKDKAKVEIKIDAVSGQPRD